MNTIQAKFKVGDVITYSNPESQFNHIFEIHGFDEGDYVVSIFDIRGYTTQTTRIVIARVDKIYRKISEEELHLMRLLA